MVLCVPNWRVGANGDRNLGSQAFDEVYDAEHRAHLVRAAHDVQCLLSTTRVQIVHGRVETLQLSEMRIGG